MAEWLKMNPMNARNDLFLRWQRDQHCSKY